ncbi:MAG: hypothetical protein AUG51_02835 [Acidobacteria bacterium 13_1_20CM_3_53_8]|nr:MAG: hypothetical protein AUG51_02835 [Acidobacteria bacterium 13_1_20CM_3_53_8]
MKETTILSIDPGTRNIGVAVLVAGELTYYAVKIIRTRRTFQEGCGGVVHTIRELIREHQPDILAIKQPLIIQQSAVSLAQVIREIKKTSQQEGVTVYEFAPKIVRQFICGTDKATKRQLAERIASQYVELTRYLKGQSKWEVLYYGKLFDAIAVGLTCCYGSIDSSE